MEQTDNQSKTNAQQRVIYSMMMYVEAYEYYEQNHLNNIIATSHYALEMNKNGDVNVFLKNLLIESLLLHLRNVMDFFYRPENKDDQTDIRITDFNGQSREIFDKYGVIYQVRKKINKHLSHLTDEDILLSDSRDWKDYVDDTNKLLFSKCLDFLEDALINNRVVAISN